MSEGSIPARFILPNGREIPLNGAMTMGRSVDNSIKLEGDAVSRRHAAVEVMQGKVILSDLSSANGTYVNEKRITIPTELREGDRVRVGSNTLTFKKSAAPARADSPAGGTIVWQTTEPLTLVRGDGAEFGLNRSMRVGRSDDNDLVLTGDTSASQHHAKIDLVAGQAIITDLTSRNGTWVNGKRISGATRLNHGDRILVGDTIFRLRLGTRPLVDAGAKPKQSSTLGVGLFLGGGILTLVVVGVVLAGLLAVGGVWYFAFRIEPTPVPVPTAAQTTSPEDSPSYVATLQAGAERLALRALVWIVAPVGNPRTTQDASTGSGSLLSEKGYVLTNFHVVGDPVSGRYYNKEGWVLVGLNWDNPDDAPNTFYRAEVVQEDNRLDLALLHIVGLENGDPLPPDIIFPSIPVGNSDDLKIGDAIAVLGFPGLGGDTPTLTRGAVSGFLFDDRNNLDRGWIKTDAEINPGNSGGMAINARGELIGVPTQAFTGTEVTGKISEIRPINFAQHFIDQIP
jgi:pSer/pThr/pTyr-binding forkhead associated (FHA) protein